MHHLSEDDDGNDILPYGWCHLKERKGQTTNSIELLDKSQATHHLWGCFLNANEDCWYKQCIPGDISFASVPELTPEHQGKAVLCVTWVERISIYFCVWDYEYDRFSIKFLGSICPCFFHMCVSLCRLVPNDAHLCGTWSLDPLQSCKMLVNKLFCGLKLPVIIE